MKIKNLYNIKLMEDYVEEQNLTDEQREIIANIETMHNVHEPYGGMSRNGYYRYCDAFNNYGIELKGSPDYYGQYFYIAGYDFSNFNQDVYTSSYEKYLARKERQKANYDKKVNDLAKLILETHTLNFSEKLKKLVYDLPQEVKDEIYTINYDDSLEHIPYICKLPNVEKVTFGPNVKIIDHNAMKDFSSLTSIELPDGLTKIDYDAFRGCVKLKTINLPSSLKDLDCAFEGCTSLQSIIIPRKIKYLYSYTFNGCSALKSISLPTRLEYIYRDCFKDCSSLTDVYYAGSKEDWEEIEGISDNDVLLNANIHFNSMLPESYRRIRGLVENIDENDIYVDGSNKYLELSDRATLLKINSMYDVNELDAEEFYTNLVNEACNEFEKITGEELYILGRSGRHVCVELTPDNKRRYKRLCRVQADLEQKVIDRMNRFDGKDWSIDF